MIKDVTEKNKKDAPMVWERFTILISPYRQSGM